MPPRGQAEQNRRPKPRPTISPRSPAPTGSFVSGSTTRISIPSHGRPLVVAHASSSSSKPQVVQTPPSSVQP
jgi:hypothetical protein